MFRLTAVALLAAPSCMDSGAGLYDPAIVDGSIKAIGVVVSRHYRDAPLVLDQVAWKYKDGLERVDLCPSPHDDCDDMYELEIQPGARCLADTNLVHEAMHTIVWWLTEKRDRTHSSPAWQDEHPATDAVRAYACADSATETQSP